MAPMQGQFWQGYPPSARSSSQPHQSAGLAVGAADRTGVLGGWPQQRLVSRNRPAIDIGRQRQQPDPSVKRRKKTSPAESEQGARCCSIPAPHAKALDEYPRAGLQRLMAVCGKQLEATERNASTRRPPSSLDSFHEWCADFISRFEHHRPPDQ